LQSIKSRQGAHRESDPFGSERKRSKALRWKGMMMMTRQTRLTFRSAVLAIALLPFAVSASLGAQISGVVKNDRDSPLSGVPVCLKLDDGNPDCIAIRMTDSNGTYTFESVELAGDYSVEVFATFSVSQARSRGSESTTRDRQARSRRLSSSIRRSQLLRADPEPREDQYSNYAWTPALATVSVVSAFDVVGDVDFTGTFNFSNYQRSIRLTGEHFPLLEQFEFATSYVFLKVYAFESDEERLIFIGQITNLDTLQIEVSLPLSVDVLLYDVFSPDASASGSIQVSTGWSETSFTGTNP
jgi:hypothetical protein